MALGERIQQLEPRERQLLSILVSVFAVLVLLALPAGVAALVGSKRSTNEDLRGAIHAIQAGRAQVAQHKEEKQRVIARYSNTAPPLAAFLEKLAGEVKLEIPESQDRAVVPHGKSYDERSTKIVLRKVGMLALVQFMEKVAQSSHPVSIGRLNVRKRGTEPDSYDVEMIVSAYDRKEEKKKEPKPAPESAPDEGEL